MTRKDYKLIADAISNVREKFSNRLKSDKQCADSHSTLDYLVEELAQELAKNNPRFNRDKFFEACKCA